MMKEKSKDEFFVKSISEKEREVRLNNTYNITSEHKYFEVMPLVINLINEKNRAEKKKYHDVFEINYFPTIEFELAKCKMEEEKCMICLEEFQIKDIEQELSK